MTPNPYKRTDRTKHRPTNRTIYYRARGSVAKLLAFRLERGAPIEDAGIPDDAWVTYETCVDEMDDELFALMDPEIRARYTTPQPFCTVPEGGEKPTQGRTKMPRDYTRDAAFERLVRSYQRDARIRRKAGDHEGAKALEAKTAEGSLPPAPSFESAVTKAGGRTFRLGA